ncbi:MAG: hypothetical protein K8F91_10870, partial [Candidatus Obscuribacterales bacterium]|nr:hypothetical protein [Candidatus Obscuribacterales bacterium]
FHDRQAKNAYQKRSSRQNLTKELHRKSHSIARELDESPDILAEKFAKILKDQTNERHQYSNKLFPKVLIAAEKKANTPSPRSEYQSGKTDKKADNSRREK